MRKVKLVGRPRAAYALVAALGLGAVAVGSASAPSAPSASAAAVGPCGPLGTLVEYELNDRCDFGTGLDPMRFGAKTVVAGLARPACSPR
jgi:hypothetical protein